MKQRLITAVFGFAVLIPLMIFSDTPVFAVAVALLAAIGVFEMIGCIGLRGKLEVLLPSLIIAFAVPIMSRYIVKLNGKISYCLAVIAAVLFIYMYYLMVLAVISKGTKSIMDMALVFLTTAYISIGFASVLMLRDLPHGQFLYLLVFIGAWVTDGAAYFVGRAIGKHKLIPDVSPKKTVEGAIGGSIFCALSFLAYGLVVAHFSDSTVNAVEIIIAGLIISVISQFGDLIASLIKRHYGIKDYGKIFPGHGGVMDRFDSIISIAPFLLMLCAYPELYAIFF